jgi:hypothetical protein
VGVELLRRDLGEKRGFADRGVGDQDVEPASLVTDDRVQPVQSPRLDTSAVTAVAASPIVAAAVSSVSLFRPVMKTCAPSAAKRWATASPIPRLPPATSATFPSSAPMIRFSFSLWPAAAAGIRAAAGWAGGPLAASSRH